MSVPPKPLREPVLVFMHSPAGLRVEYDLDRSRLELWGSPGVHADSSALERDFSNRDVHMTLFESIRFPGCGLERFRFCEYDPWHVELHFEAQALHLAVKPDEAAVLIWVEAPQAVELVTDGADIVEQASDSVIRVLHSERGRRFRFAFEGPEGFGLRHSPNRAHGTLVYSRGELLPGPGLKVGVEELFQKEPTDQTDPADRTVEDWLAQTEAWLAPMSAAGRLVAPADPLLERMRRLNRRGLASMVDPAGGVRASIKAIYYVTWIRDAVFTAAGCVSAGRPLRLKELCGLLLRTPCLVVEQGLPAGRMFAQLIRPDGGKLEEDGIFYVLWAVFLHWSHSGDREFCSGDSAVLLREAADWVDRRCFDSERGLYGGHFADETPAWGSRDHGWDHVTGQPLDGSDHIRVDGRPVIRSYDIYLNTLMHTVWSMLARMMDDPAAQARADVLWEKLRGFYVDRNDGLPAYGDLVLRDGGEQRVYAWGPVSSVYVWALSLPNFLPLNDRDTVQIRLVERLSEEPRMHWNNGLCAAIAACDSWFCGEATGLSLLKRISEDAMKPGPWHPISGAMPEKFEAPQGNLYHDIRPQAFAMGAWLGALASFGLRTLPHGLALRPTRAYQGIQNHEAFGRVFDLDFTPEAEPVLRVNGQACPHTLQVPETLLRAGKNTLALGGRPAEHPLLLRSDARLLAVEHTGKLVIYFLEVHGAAELLFEGCPEEVEAADEDECILPVRVVEQGTRSLLRLKSRGRVRVSFGHISEVAT